MAYTLASPEIARQRDIWTNLYGPAQAEELIGKLVALLEAEPALALGAAIDRVDPDSDEDYEGWFASRW